MEQHWTRGLPIGQGSSATVSVATNHRSGEIFAVKSMEFSKSKLLQREKEILSSISSPYVVQYIGSDVSDSMYNLFMEYIAGGTLTGLIQTRGGRLDEDSIRSFTREILLGLDYLHTNGLVHCDIKGRNILISPNGAKIADLGSARWIDECYQVSQISGTPVFMSPEVARGEEQGFPADVWALGCTMIEMATGNLPWPEVKNNVAALYKIGFCDQVPEFPSYLSEEAKDFLSKCLQRDPKERWTTYQLLNHSFVSSSCSKQIQVSTSNSPTSILDQDMWDSFEESYASPDSSNSATERIQKFSSPSMPNWDLEEDWITIRANEKAESSSDRVLDDPATTSGSDRVFEEELEKCESSVFSVSDLEKDCLLSIRITDSNSKNSSNRLCRKRCFGEVTNCLDSNLIFETQKEFKFTVNTNFFRS